MRIASGCILAAALLMVAALAAPWGCRQPHSESEGTAAAPAPLPPDSTASRPPVVLPPPIENTSPLQATPAEPPSSPPEPAAPPAPPETPAAGTPPAAVQPTPGERPEEFGFRLRKIKDGMTYEEVTAIIGPPAFTVSGAGTDTVIYQWNNEGTKFAARFERNRLTRKSGVKSAPGEDAGKPALTQEQYDKITEGMTLEDVTALLKVEAHLVTGKGDACSIYKWIDEAGSSFTARFENGKLTRKTGFYVAALDKSNEEPAADTETAEEGEFFPPEGEEPPLETMEDTLDGEAETSAPQDTPPAENTPQPPQTTQAPVRESKVRVLGAARREQRRAQSPPEIAGRSYKPKAKLPEYTYSLRRGAYEVRIHNEGGDTARVGIRKTNRGKDISIPAGGVKSFYVDQGGYSLYYLFSGEPYALQKGPAITIDGWFLSDVELFIRDDGAEAYQ